MQKLVTILLLVVPAALCYGQISEVYSQKQLQRAGVSDVYVWGLSAADTNGGIVGFLQKRGYFFIDPSDWSAWIDTSYPSAAGQEQATFITYGNGFIALAHGTQNDHCVYDADLGFRRLNVPDSLQRFVGYGMRWFPGNYFLNTNPRVISNDLGETWYPWPDSLRLSLSDVNGFSRPYFESVLSKRTYEYGIESDTVDLRITPLIRSSAFTARLHEKALVWFLDDQRPTIRVGNIGGTSYREYSGIRHGDSTYPIKPNQFMNLESGSVFYLYRTPIVRTIIPEIMYKRT
ncbi:MAG: hypothetical protein HQ472_04900 [Ignavibacteria bacterium]|nr:hypothetical protein [Ignavibacteria bacterium]